MGDEVLIEVAESEEQSDFFDRGGGLPIFDSREFGGVHGYLARAYDHTKIVDFLDVK